MRPTLRDWFVSTIDCRALLTPFSRVKRYISRTAGVTTYTFTYHDYYVFGFRIARIQQ